MELILRVNYWAIFVSALVYWGIGWLWYSFIFHDVWLKAHMASERKEMEKSHRKQGELLEQLMIAVVAWAGFTAAVGVDEVILEGKHTNLFMLQTGYHLVGVIAAAVVQVLLHYSN